MPMLMPMLRSWDKKGATAMVKAMITLLLQVLPERWWVFVLHVLVLQWRFWAFYSLSMIERSGQQNRSKSQSTHVGNKTKMLQLQCH